MLSMLDACSAPTDVLQATPLVADPVQELRDLIERMQAELKFNQTKIAALNFEIARLKVCVRPSHLDAGP